MNLRDEFAFKALAILHNTLDLSAEDASQEELEEASDHFKNSALTAYYMADVMIEARDMDASV